MTATSRAARPPLWRDQRVLRIAGQLAAVGAAALVVGYVWDNLQANLRQLGIPTSWDFLDQPIGFQIPYSDLRPTQPVRDALWVAAKNTALSAVVGIVLCTVLGLVVGIARLSANWLVRKAAAVYVEALRNLPPLLIILFVNNAVLLELPRIQDPIDAGGLLVISNRQMGVVSFRSDDGATAWFVVVVVAALAAAVVAVWRHRVHDRTGAPPRPWVYAGLPWLAVAGATYLALGTPVEPSRPEAVGLSIMGGASLSIPYAAVTVALALYTSSHVAEIVRGSILAVPKGQSEAATALGLTNGQRLRHVVLPQALRIAIPPTVNQFLNLTKNTSLGIAVAYSELTTVVTVAIGNGQPAVQMVLVAMGVYLTFSLTISVLLNVYNRRFRLVER